MTVTVVPANIDAMGYCMVVTLGADGTTITAWAKMRPDVVPLHIERLGGVLLTATAAAQVTKAGAVMLNADGTVAPISTDPAVALAAAKAAASARVNAAVAQAATRTLSPADGLAQIAAATTPDQVAAIEAAIQWPTP